MDIVSSDGLLTFDDLKRQRGLPNHMFFRYLQLRHAFRSQFPLPTVLEVEHRMTIGCCGRSKTMSTLYSLLVSLDTSNVLQLFAEWQSDIPTLADDNWEEGIQQYLPLMVSARHRFAQVKFLHRAYFSPQRLAKIYPTTSSVCPKCSSKGGLLFPCFLGLSTYTNFLEGISHCHYLCR